jgi:transcriptional regulator with XRE-family HTH domain
MKTTCFAHRLRTARQKAGYTQGQLASLIGRTRSVVTNYEAGRVQPTPDGLSRIASRLAVTTDYLLGREARPHPKQRP